MAKKAMPKGMSPAAFEKSGKDNDKGMKEGSRADRLRDIEEGLRPTAPKKKGKK